MSEKIKGDSSAAILRKLKLSILIIFISAFFAFITPFSQTSTATGFYMTGTVLIGSKVGVFIVGILFMVSLYRALKFILTSIDILLEKKND
ncbi:hypothetical protein [Clostridium sp. LIBA-8841]|uniref:hypothetical protein n=1 Tax=Clostridium sp. LIBA-8841 TaxID=2987530 RepID=UPI002AC5EF30|nr:hypothetical protein [Clostridium sp. LIBA-8841]MDZ5253761.1 hypothetical protein [Clostridium sp. LIBA-8841]